VVASTSDGLRAQGKIYIISACDLKYSIRLTMIFKWVFSWRPDDVEPYGFSGNQKDYPLMTHFISMDSVFEEKEPLSINIPPDVTITFLSPTDPGWITGGMKRRYLAGFRG
jgi:hypothetical protein